MKYNNMKKIITLLLLLSLLSANTYAKDKTFTDRYLELRQSEEGIELQRLEKEDIKTLMDGFESAEQTEEDRKYYEKEKAVFQNARQVVMGFDMDEDEMLGFREMNDLVKTYEELFTMDVDGMNVQILALSKKKKINELIALMNMGDEGCMFLDVVFEKPINEDEWMGIVGDISFNDVNVGDIMNNEGFIENSDDWKIIKQGNKYGMADTDGNILVDARYRKIKANGKKQQVEAIDFDGEKEVIDL
jgi:hypothetical protein